MVNVTLRDFDDRLYRALKSEAVRDDLTMVEALSAAVALWLKEHTHAKKKKSVFDFKPVDFGPGSERSSEEIDDVVYGKEVD